MRSPIARSSAGILARLSRSILRPSARSSSGFVLDAALRSRAVAATAARSASLKTLSSFRDTYLLLVADLAGMRGAPQCVGESGRGLGRFLAGFAPDRGRTLLQD